MQNDGDLSSTAKLSTGKMDEVNGQARQNVQNSSAQHKSIAATDRGQVLIIGEALLDCFADTMVPGGAPFNVARTLGAFGMAPHLITRIGKDSAGGQLLDQFRRFRLPTDGVQLDDARTTGMVTVKSGAAGHTFTIGLDAAWDAIDPATAAALAQSLSPSIICFGTLAQRAPTSRAAVAAVLEKTTALRVLDLNLRPTADHKDIAAWSLHHADVVKVNDGELAQLLTWFVPTFGPAAQAWGSIQQLRAIEALGGIFSWRNLVVTRGADGYAAFDSRGKLIAFGDAPHTTVIDTVGAGDGFLAILILGEILGWPFPQSLLRASHFAAGVCTFRGAVADDLAFYQQWATQWDTSITGEPFTTTRTA